MSKLTVKYHNDMNNISFRKFNQLELDLFFTICASIKESGTSEVIYSFEKLAELSKYSRKGIERFVKDLESTYDKLLQIPIKIGDNRNFTKFILFTKYEINTDEKVVAISVNNEFKYILNEITSNFTRFELKEFTSLSSTYTKSLYRLLKQFRMTGYYKVKVEELREILDIPSSYKMANIDQRVLKPSMEELVKYFKGLRLNKIKTKKGNKIEYFEFIFCKEDVFVDNNSNVSFIDENGNYYKRNLLELTEEEIENKFGSD